MNLVIHNFGPYRVTDHGRAGDPHRFQLFNRQTDAVFGISAEEYDYIMLAENAEDALASCHEVEADAIERREAAV